MLLAAFATCAPVAFAITIMAMNLHDYLQSDGALTVSELRNAIGAKSGAQIRQWQHGYANRRPSPENCAAIEQATAGAVTCDDLRPELRWERRVDPAWPWHPDGRPLLCVTAETA